ncbi:MAG: glycerol-3-phosphate dehydrogenase/oxidase [Candidatus Eremiobacteraeota bacterium]|nr:glycerol-3-phosphate dehydrogenase/oxidase [Candidatus Eremiobacteraeota bacterium]
MLRARATAWRRLTAEPFDVLVIGGGVTGAAIAYEAARRGLRCALVERGDFASGTSSRSSKLVHGGLRYLKEGHIALTRESVREREALLRDAPGLVDAIEFVMPHYRGRKPGRATLAAGLAIYDALGGSWQHRYSRAGDTLALVPVLDDRALLGAHVYRDATTDDARLVLRLLTAASTAGATVLNYANAAPAMESGNVVGAYVTDIAGGRSAEVRARAVISATGAFADGLRECVGAAPRLRPLRGSHVLFPAWRAPLAVAVAFEHPSDGRPVFAYPWQGATLAGTTDLDHDGGFEKEPSIAPGEVAYLLDAMRYQFPSLGLTAGDVVSTYAGIRPVVDNAHAQAPSRVSRDHVVWHERGLITITGGKLTTFRPMALDALRAAAPRLPSFDAAPRPIFVRHPGGRLSGRYGENAAAVAAIAKDGELETIGTTPFLWAELRWAARNEGVVHLDDLLLRRTRAGLLLHDGATQHFDRIAAICRDELQWDAHVWESERGRYETIRREHYSLP